MQSHLYSIIYVIHVIFKQSLLKLSFHGSKFIIDLSTYCIFSLRLEQLLHYIMPFYLQTNQIGTSSVHFIHHLFNANSFILICTTLT